MNPTSGSISLGTLLSGGNENLKRWMKDARNKNISVSAKVFPGHIRFPNPKGTYFSFGLYFPFSSRNLIRMILLFNFFVDRIIKL